MHHHCKCYIGWHQDSADPQKSPLVEKYLKFSRWGHQDYLEFLDESSTQHHLVWGIYTDEPSKTLFSGAWAFCFHFTKICGKMYCFLKFKFINFFVFINNFISNETQFYNIETYFNSVRLRKLWNWLMNTKPLYCDPNIYYNHCNTKSDKQNWTIEEIRFVTSNMESWYTQWTKMVTLLRDAVKAII